MLEIFACLISSVLQGTCMKLRAIDLLFDSKNFQSFLCDGRAFCLKSHWLIKALYYFIFFLDFS